MKTNDDNIKRALKNNIQRIDDDSFTNSIVAKYLAADKKSESSTFINFLPMIIGLTSIILSIGFVFLVRLNNDWINEIGFTEYHGLIILGISIIFLIFKLMEEMVAPGRQHV